MTNESPSTVPDPDEQVDDVVDEAEPIAPPPAIRTGSRAADAPAPAEPPFTRDRGAVTVDCLLLRARRGRHVESRLVTTTSFIKGRSSTIVFDCLRA